MLFRSMINNQTFWNPFALPTDKTVNFVRPPEYFGKAVMITPNGATQTGNVVTIATGYAHGFIKGAPVLVAGVSDRRYNGVYTITAVSPTTFSYNSALAGLPPAGYGSASNQQTFRYVGGANAPWTAYDTNNLFLAQVGADGTVYMPSFRRPWLDNFVNSLPAAQQAAVRKYMILRPDQTWNPQFVTPDSDVDAAGRPLYDVKNLEFGPGVPRPGGGFYNNDSMWIDMGFPVMTAPNGKRYKVLVAPLIMDLSNRLHLWAHGNVDNASNQGFGSPEVNLAKLPGIAGAAAVNVTRQTELKNYLTWRATTTQIGRASCRERV